MNSGLPHSRPGAKPKFTVHQRSAVIRTAHYGEYCARELKEIHAVSVGVRRTQQVLNVNTNLQYTKSKKGPFLTKNTK